MKTCFNTVDLFCGLGGSVTGLHTFCQRRGYTYRGLAVNHWSVAVNTMRANYRNVRTVEMRLEDAVPEEMAPREIDLLWASPSCTHHSRARGGRPRSNQLRSQPDLINPWLDQLFVRRRIVENVPEFLDWGPLGKDGRPLASKKGECFRAWVQGIEARNYTVEWRIINCADYGDATTRKRFFLQAVRRGCGRIVWPTPTHAEDPQPDLWGNMPKRWRGIRECLDLSDTGRSIFNRDRPLAENTLRRVFVGLRKFCGLDFQMDMLGADGPDEPRLRSTDDPIATQPAGGNRTALVRSFLVRFNRNGDAESIDAPLSCVTAGGQHHALCNAFIVRNNKGCFAEDADKPLSSQQSHTVHHALCTPVIIDHFKGGEPHPDTDPIGSQTTHGRFSLVQAFAVDLSHPGDKNDESRLMAGDSPLKTQTTLNNAAAAFIVTAQANNAPRSADKPIRAQTTVRKDYVVRPFVLGQQSGATLRPASEPAPTISCAGALRGVYLVTQDGLVIDVRMRMLKPSELAAAHSFPKDYVLTGTRTEQVKQIGNSVPVMTAAALCEAALAS